MACGRAVLLTGAGLESPGGRGPGAGVIVACRDRRRRTARPPHPLLEGRVLLLLVGGLALGRARPARTGAGADRRLRRRRDPGDDEPRRQRAADRLPRMVGPGHQRGGLVQLGSQPMGRSTGRGPAPMCSRSTATGRTTGGPTSSTSSTSRWERRRRSPSRNSSCRPGSSPDASRPWRQEWKQAVDDPGRFAASRYVVSPGGVQLATGLANGDRRLPGDPLREGGPSGAGTSTR